MSHRDASASVGHKHEHAIEHPIRVRILNDLGEQQLLSPLDAVQRAGAPAAPRHLPLPPPAAARRDRASRA